MHSPDCALVQYADIDPRTLKRPLECDGVECDGQDTGTEYIGDAALEVAQAAGHHQIHTGPTATLTGDAASTFKAFQSAERELRAAQQRRDAALRAFTEAVTR